MSDRRRAASVFLLAVSLALALGCGGAQRPVTVTAFDGSASAWPDTSAPFNVLALQPHRRIPTRVDPDGDRRADGAAVGGPLRRRDDRGPDAVLARQPGAVPGGGVPADHRRRARRRQQAAFEAWIGAGGNYVGVHSAADTEYDWPFYGTLVGAYFVSHPDVQQASVDVEATGNPDPPPGCRRPGRAPTSGTTSTPTPAPRSPCWRPSTNRLTPAGRWAPTTRSCGAHPTGGGGRAFYTAMGHTDDSYRDPLFQRLLVSALRWAAGR